MLVVLRITITFLCLIGMAEKSFSEEIATKQEKRFSNETIFSMVTTRGNTDTLTLAGENEMTYKFSEKWAGSWGAGAVYKEVDSTNKIERYFADLRMDASITELWYVYLLASWDRDEFSGSDHRLGLGPGMGCKFLNGPKHFLFGELGLNYRYEDYAGSETDSEQFMEGRLFGKYKWAFTEKTNFSQKLEYLQSYKQEKTLKLKSDTALITALNKTMALKLNYSVLYNNNPIPSTLENIDSTFTTSLVIKF